MFARLRGDLSHGHGKEASERGAARSESLPASVSSRGSDDHLFHTNNFVCEQIFEAHGLTEVGCSNWLRCQMRRVEWLAARSISYRLLIIPEHHAIYSDKVPGRPSPAPNRPIMRLLQMADPRVRDVLVYPLEQLRDGRARFETSYAHDVHFTRYGAYLCYLALMQSLYGTRDSLVREEDLVSREVIVAGDVAHAYGAYGRRFSGSILLGKAQRLS